MRTLQRLRADSRYTIIGFPTSIASFSLTIAGVAAGIGSAVAFVGLPILAGTAAMGRRFADLERSSIATIVDHPVESPAYTEAPSWAGWFRRVMNPLLNGQAGLDLLHAVLSFPLAIVSFVLTVTWWAGTVLGLTFPLYGWILFNTIGPEGSLPALLGFGGGLAGYVTFNTVVGVLFAITLVPVVRLAALVRASLGEALLTRAVHGTRPSRVAMAA
ncbi:MAG: sensor domain-containing protein [Thermoactinospora sp.]|nr:sensor domain-containing protein [Thermoactinospora sp.]